MSGGKIPGQGFIKNSEMFPKDFLTVLWKGNMMEKEIWAQNVLEYVTAGSERPTDRRENNGKISGQNGAVYVRTVWGRPAEQVFNGDCYGSSGGFSCFSLPIFLLVDDPGDCPCLFSDAV